uniref:Uncharacterized protein n=1 Tax=Oryza rufipogon TaxID=4529 RepID=A0A0E0NKG5_ORYRU
MRLASLPPSWPALQPAHPTLLRHHKPVIPSQPLSGPPLSPRSSTPRRNPQFWLESPPPPPSRSAVPFSADDACKRAMIRPTHHHHRANRLEPTPRPPSARQHCSRHGGCVEDGDAAAADYSCANDGTR